MATFRWPQTSWRNKTTGFPSVRQQCPALFSLPTSRPRWGYVGLYCLHWDCSPVFAPAPDTQPAWGLIQKPHNENSRPMRSGILVKDAHHFRYLHCASM